MHAYVINRCGQPKELRFDRITERLSPLLHDLDTNFVDAAIITQKVVSFIQSGMHTKDIDELAGEQAVSMTSHHPHFSLLGGRILVTNLHKQLGSFSESVKALDPAGTFFSEQFRHVVSRYASLLDHEVQEHLDLSFDYFAIRTLLKSYLLRDESGQVLETPQFLFLRVALALYGEDLDSVLDTYRLQSQKFYCHASPTLQNAGLTSAHLSSCFLLVIPEDDLGSIYDTLKQCALISKHSGGIGLALHNIRAKGSLIKSSRGHSNGLVPMLRNFNATARYCDQGGGKRKGAFAVYLEPWHRDIFDFLALKLNTGPEEERCRDLFIALWVPDLFMKRAERDSYWTLFCPSDAPGLHLLVGKSFEQKYTEYESLFDTQRIPGVRIKARFLFSKILESQRLTGTPYMLYKDACNRKSNQRNLGTIQGSNLCCEIVEYASKDEIAVCNLAAVNLSKFVRNTPTRSYHMSGRRPGTWFDFDLLHLVSRKVTRNLNQVLDTNFYRLPETSNSNLKHRPIAVGEVGFADACFLLGFPFESKEAHELNVRICETMYHACLTESMELAKVAGPYESFSNSPLAQGLFQFDLWRAEQESEPFLDKLDLDSLFKMQHYDWSTLRTQIQEHGVRNSLLRARQPTATIAQIMGVNEACEPVTSNLYLRRVMSGDTPLVNRYLIRDLVDLGLWNEDRRLALIASHGSVATMMDLPLWVRDLYKTVFEMKGSTLLRMAAEASIYICQSISLNAWIEDTKDSTLTKYHFLAWKLGLKTGMYYLRTKPAREAIPFTLPAVPLKKPPKEKECGDFVCTSCQ